MCKQPMQWSSQVSKTPLCRFSESFDDLYWRWWNILTLCSCSLGTSWIILKTWKSNFFASISNIKIFYLALKIWCVFYTPLDRLKKLFRWIPHVLVAPTYHAERVACVPYKEKEFLLPWLNFWICFIRNKIWVYKIF